MSFQQSLLVFTLCQPSFLMSAITLNPIITFQTSFNSAKANKTQHEFLRLQTQAARIYYCLGVSTASDEKKLAALNSTTGKMMKELFQEIIRKNGLQEFVKFQVTTRALSGAITNEKQKLQRLLNQQ